MLAVNEIHTANQWLKFLLPQNTVRSIQNGWFHCYVIVRLGICTFNGLYTGNKR